MRLGWNEKKRNALNVLNALNAFASLSRSLDHGRSAGPSTRPASGRSLSVTFCSVLHLPKSWSLRADKRSQNQSCFAIFSQQAYTPHSTSNSAICNRKKMNTFHRLMDYPLPEAIHLTWFNSLILFCLEFQICHWLDHLLSLLMSILKYSRRLWVIPSEQSAQEFWVLWRICAERIEESWW